MSVYTLNDALIIHFDGNDISIHTGRNAEKPFDDELIFHLIPEGQRGKPLEDIIGKTTDDLTVPLRIIFERPEALDGMIRTLEILRRRMNLGKGAHGNRN